MTGLHNIDCIDGMRALPDGSIDALITDPPYFEIKGDFDFQYTSFEAYLEFVEKCAKEIKRILKPTGTIIWFGHALNIAYSQIIFDKYFNLLNSCVWRKTECQAMRNEKEAQRSFIPITERFLVYEHYGANGLPRTGLEEIHSNPDCFTSIKEYMRSELKKYMAHYGYTSKTKAGKSLDALCGTSSVIERHYFADSQYMFPTQEIYIKLQSTGFWRKEYEDLRKEYEDLRKEYEDLRKEYEDLRRPFVLNNFALYDVIDCSQQSNITAKYAHPTQKPPRLITALIQTVTKKGGLVLDCFAGSGTTAECCILEDRDFLCFETDKKYYDIASKRIEQATIKRKSQLF